MTDQNDKAASPAEVREWARANGFVVGDRGRLSQDVRDAFTEATGRKIWDRHAPVEDARAPSIAETATLF